MFVSAKSFVPSKEAIKVSGDKVVQRQDFSLLRGVLISGRIIDGYDSKPIVNALVVIILHGATNLHFIFPCRDAKIANNTKTLRPLRLCERLKKTQFMPSLSINLKLAMEAI